ncbi:MAG: MarR family transcriptional regulator [Anaerolineales bacterium]|nr:MarR family transcriptional regulator [Anaerolineales bacterium]
MPNADPFTDALHEWIESFMHHSMRNFILYAKEKGLSMSQIGALFHLHRMGTCGVSDIGDDLGVTSAAASQMLERLVQQELITRSEDPNDRRGKQIILTDRGQQTVRQAILARQHWLDQLAASLTPGEKQQVLTALQILTARSSQLGDGPN